jgi:DNA-binding transcriptional LysR family regulator
MNISVAEKKFYDFIVSFKHAHPDAKLSITVENTTKIEEQIMKNELDLAIVDHILDAGSTVALPVSSEHMAAVCSPKYKTFPGNSLSAAELAGEELLLRERGSGARAAIDAIFYQRQLTPNRIMESVSTLALAKAAESGLGITILPRDIVREQLEAGSLVELSTPYISFTRNYYLTYRRQKYLTGIMRQFCDEIRTKIPVSQNDSAGV